MIKAEEMLRDYWLKVSNLRQDLSQSIDAYNKSELDVHDIKAINRELALAHTKLQEAELWLKTAFDNIDNKLK